MNALKEIELAIEKLAPEHLNELAHWIDQLRAKQTQSINIETWLERARGAAIPGLSTDGILSHSRGDE